MCLKLCFDLKKIPLLCENLSNKLFSFLNFAFLVVETQRATVLQEYFSPVKVSVNVVGKAPFR